MRWIWYILIAAMLLSSGCAGKRSTDSSPSSPTASGSMISAPEQRETIRIAEPQTTTVPSNDQSPRSIKLSDDITVHLNTPVGSCVEIRAKTCLDEGYLEQIACAPRSREHESLVVVGATPSQIHTALLMAGFESGTPGQWVYENNTISTRNPTGERLEVCVRYADATGNIIEHPVRDWIRSHSQHNQNENVDPSADRSFPKIPWVFGGSRFAPNLPHMGPGEHYVADVTGSIIGLVTFGDEVIGLSRVLSDQAEIQPQEWEVNTALIPAMETAVTLVVRRWNDEARNQ